MPRPTVELVTRSAGDVDLELARRCFDSVLRPSFSEAELPDLETVVDTATGALQLGLVVAESVEGVVGVGCWSHQAGTPVGQLCYLAVRPGLRSRGIGSLLLTRLRSEWSVRPGLDLVIGEIHDPRDHRTSETERPMDRMDFYQREGAQLIDLPWVQPELRAGFSRVPGMLLISVYRSPRTAVSAQVPADVLTTWATDYYLDEEGTTPADPQYRTLLGRFTERPLVPIRGLEDFRLIDPLSEGTAGSTQE